jgi:hypothetical protein
MKRHNFRSNLASLLEAVALAGTVVLAALVVSQRADAATGLCAQGTPCQGGMSFESQHAQRYQAALQRSAFSAAALHRAEMSDQDYSAFSGIGVIACSVGGQTRSSTAFLVGAFDIAVTVAHTFELDGIGAQAQDCVYNSTDSRGQIRERIPISYVKSQWSAEAGAAGEPAKDLAVVRLSHSSRYAQRTLPLGRFTGDTAPAVMVGFRSDISAGTLKRKSRGTVYERAFDDNATGIRAAGLAGFVHDMDARGISAGAPVIDERTGVIIGIHMRLASARNTMITMNDWLEATLRQEMQAHAQLQSEAESTPN